MAVVFAAAFTLMFTTTTRAQTIEYYGLDHLGSVRVIFNQAGNTVARMDYGPFGENLRQAIKLPTEQFALLARDAESGKDYAEARNYSSSTGRFTSLDPVFAGLFDPQQWNRYAYARNNPLVYIDPSGLKSTPLCFGRQSDSDYPCIEPTGEEAEEAQNNSDALRQGKGSKTGKGKPPTKPDTPKDPKTPEKPKTPEPCTPPTFPPGTSVDENIDTTRTVRKMVALGSLTNPRNIGKDIAWWVNMVKTGGRWDYKQEGQTPESQYEQAGNFNYGATGRALGLPRVIIHAGAGAASIYSDPSRLTNGSVSPWYLFDDSRDYADVAAGITYVDKGCDKK